jgi:hypothetical protein
MIAIEGIPKEEIGSRVIAMKPESFGSKVGKL